jgi:hypothetical protein
MPDTQPHPSRGDDDRRTRIVRWIVWMLFLGLTLWFLLDLLISP